MKTASVLVRESLISTFKDNHLSYRTGQSLTILIFLLAMQIFKQRRKFDGKSSFRGENSARSGTRVATRLQNRVYFRVWGLEMIFFSWNRPLTLSLPNCRAASKLAVSAAKFTHTDIKMLVLTFRVPLLDRSCR